MDIKPDNDRLLELVHYKMPYGKFKGKYLIDLPEAYLVWFQRKGFPQGKLGNLLRSTLEIKTNGLESLIRKIRNDFPPDRH
ncbi:DUF3820 family protein [Spongiimicrobium sp. 3-5]|uniref:DUF3820 family protein n=1 Tax=Spongiimicrobium sp. 3-5 TaxID=3332596 RepID=UPI003980A4D7